MFCKGSNRKCIRLCEPRDKIKDTMKLLIKQERTTNFHKFPVDAIQNMLIIITFIELIFCNKTLLMRRMESLLGEGKHFD